MKGLEFTNLPLVEVSVRLFFDRDVKLTLEKGVEAWGRLEQRFPSFVDSDQVEPGLGGRPSSQFALVPGSADFAHFGFRYTGGQSGLDLRLQTNLISISWNKGFDSKSTPYPRFDALEDNLWWATDVLREALPLPEIRALNMRYGNFVPTDEKGAGTVLQDYFSEATWAPLLKGATQLHGVDFNWREADEIDRRFAISRGESRRREHGRPGLPGRDGGRRDGSSRPITSDPSVGTPRLPAEVLFRVDLETSQRGVETCRVATQ